MSSATATTTPLSKQPKTIQHEACLLGQRQHGRADHRSVAVRPGIFGVSFERDFSSGCPTMSSDALDQCIEVLDFEAIARQNLHKMAFDYYVSGANDQITLRE